MIQFNIDHATQLRNSIASFQAIYSEEWLDLIQRLQDLQQVWNDTHRLDFERDFNNLTTIHQQIDRELEPQLQELDRVTHVIDKTKEQLIHLSENTTTQPSTHTNQPSAKPPASTDNQNNATGQNKSAAKQEIEQTIDRFPNLYNASIASFQSLSKTSVSAFSMGLVVFAMANGIYNFQGVKFFEAIISPKTVIQTSASDCDQESENKVSFNRLLSFTENVTDRELKTSLNEHYEHLTEDGLEQRTKKEEDKKAQEASNQQRQQAQTSASK